MIITDVQEFLTYYKKIRSRTLHVISYIPKDKIEWTYEDGKFTFGDLIRHIANIERFMYAENALFKPSQYSGHGVQFASGYDETVQYLNDMHQESISIFSSLTNEELEKKCETPGGVSITLWKWLRAMIEHEIHHRGQIFIYLGMLGEPLPALYGLTAEEVEARSKKS